MMEKQMLFTQATKKMSTFVTTNPSIVKTNPIILPIMRLIIQKDYDGMSKWAAEYVIDKINAFQPTKDKPFVLGLATGSSPEGFYREVVAAYKAGRISFKNVVTFNMDEYEL